MHTDDDFLRAILANPADDTARLVYADWLDEQGDDASRLKAEFLRFELGAAKLSNETLRRAAINSRVRKRAADLDPGWLAAVSHPALEECRLRFEFECPMQWANLTATEDVKVRFCGECKRNVHYCDTIEEARTHARKGDCVAVSLALARKPNDLARPRPMLAGVVRLTPDQIERIRLRQLSTVTVGVADGSLSRIPPTPSSPPAAPERRDEPRRTKRQEPRRKSRRQNRNITADELGE